MRKKHGLVNTKSYKIWSNMKDRCFNKNNSQYKNYGDRGISVCAEWMDFKNFFADMGEKPNGMSIERLDNNAGYSKKNCKWASAKEQSRNRRANTFITYKNKTKCIAEWAEITGINCQVIRIRFLKGMSPREILTKKVRKKRKITFNGITKSIPKWAEYLGIKEITLYKRIDRGMPIEKALTPKKFR